MMRTIGYILNCQGQKHNNSINNIQFTNREIEIISCLLNARGVKKIANLLSISPKTVEVHIRNIMLKVKCNSREKVIDFFETSQEYVKLIDYYKLILENSYFSLALKKVKTSLKTANVLKFVFIESLSKKNDLIINLLQEALQQIDTIVTKHSLSEVSIEPTKQIVYILTNDLEEKELEIYIKKNNYKQGAIIYLNTISNIEIKGFSRILIRDESSFPLSVLELLCSVNLRQDIYQIKEKFSKQFNSLYDINSKKIDQNKGGNDDLNKKLAQLKENAFVDNDKNTKLDNYIRLHKFVHSGMAKYKKIIKSFFAISLFCFFCFSQMSLKSKYTQPDLWIPSESVLLTRNHVIKKITSIFKKDNNKIKNTMVVGVGGAGKTVIARYYALKNNNNIFWEINAESEMEIIKSFEKLAISLAKNKESRKELEQIYKFHNMDNFKSDLMMFIQRRLYKNPNWLLIYDNVDNFHDLMAYLPRNENIWGKGKVLILTRNQNIVHNKYIERNNIIYMPNLTYEEKEKLFLKIYSLEKNKRLDNKGDYNLKNFLAQIPSFPLDVVTAAYFIRNTGANHDEYLKNINSHEIDLKALDINILEDTNKSLKTRYNVVINAIRKIIGYSDNFKDKLIAISMLPHNDIPLELLYDNDEGKETLINLLRELSRYSFINYEDSIINRHISLHKSVHDIISFNLKEEFHNKHAMYQVDLLTKRLAKKLSFHIDKEHILQIRTSLILAEKLLENRIHQNEEGEKLKYQIGKAYRYLGQFKEAIKILENVEKFEDNVDLLLELGTTYKNIGKYNKSIYLIERALNLSKTKYGPNSIQTALVEIRLDTPYRKLRKYKKAKQLLEHSLKVYESYPNSNEIIAWIYTKSGHLNVKLGHFNESITLLEKSLSIQKNLYESEHIRIAWTYVRMANAYKELKKYHLARDLFQKSFKIAKNHYGMNHTKTAWVLCALGEVEGLLGNFYSAENKIKEALDIQKQYYGGSSVRIVWALKKLGKLYEREKKLTQSEYYFDLVKKINQTN